MTHLTQEELLDVADGTRTGDQLPHLQSCAACARQVADLRGAIDAAAEVRIPDPSPLFWDHLSQRVREAVADERRAAARRSSFVEGPWLRWTLAAAVVAVLVVVVARIPRQVPTSAGDAPATMSGDFSQPVELPAFEDDAALALLADLTWGMDWDSTAEAGLVPDEGAVDRVVFALSAEERVELHRLLQEALEGSGV
jgi:hypothetical protein